VKYLLTLLILLSAAFSEGKEPLKIVVIDTGFRASSLYSVPLCADWHYDAIAIFPKKESVPPLDNHGHGTHIVGVIHQFATGKILGFPDSVPWTQKRLQALAAIKEQRYCFVIVRYFDGVSRENYKGALRYVETIPGPFILNVSLGGPERQLFEKAAVARLQKRGIKIIAAAGNEGQNLAPVTKYSHKASHGSYYPAQEPGVVAVGAYEFLWKPEPGRMLLRKDTKSKTPVYLYKLKKSNYGHSGMVYRLGHLYAAGLNNDIVALRGTSQAAAVETGLTIQRYLKTLKENK